ncbi:MAG: hypothetical protein IKM08_03120 [Clostridia bacterium]|nr:hypothetical protein [Clostridia bacterium]
MFKLQTIAKALVCLLLIGCMLLVGSPTAPVASVLLTERGEIITEAFTPLLLQAGAKSTAPLEIYFFELNPDELNTAGDFRHDTGDSCIIRIGDVEILVDAGATAHSAPLITEKMEQLISEDHVWDYIIVTHSDSDHISGFPGDKGVFSKFKQTAEDENGWALGTLIDFDITKDDSITEEAYPNKSNLFVTLPDATVKDDNEEDPVGEVWKGTYTKYAKARDAAVSASGANYYTASQCCWEDRNLSEAPKEGADSEFKLGNGATLHILYNYFYDHPYTKDQFTSADKNLLSVCFLIELKGTDGARQTFLFTGDLPEYDSGSKATSEDEVESKGDYSKHTNGEKKLIEHERNKELLEGGVTFYKAAHHGSRTSSSQEFIDFIRPQYVAISAVAGTRRYTQNGSNVFPAETVMTRLFKYTDHVYITEKAKNEDAVNDKNEPVVKTVDADPYYKGQSILRFVADGDSVQVNTLNTLGEGAKEAVPPTVQYTEWFTQNRTATLNVFVFDDMEIKGISRCTLLKYGHIDILIDCGVASRDAAGTESMCFVDRIKEYCVDGVLEYVIVTGSQTASISQMIGQYSQNEPLGNGIMDQFVIENLIDYGQTSSVASETGWIARYEAKREDLKQSKQIKEYLPRGNGTVEFTVCQNLKLRLFNTQQKSYSLGAMVTFYDQKLLFVGANNSEDSENALLREAGESISDVTLYLTGGNVGEKTNSEDFLKEVHALYTVITTPADYVSANGRNMTEFATLQRLVALSYAKEEIDENNQKNSPKRVYMTSCMMGGQKESICGSMTFSIRVRDKKVQRTSLKGENGTTLLHLTDWYKNKLEEKK